MKTNEYDAYVAFYQELGVVPQGRRRQDWANREKLADLLLLRVDEDRAGQVHDAGRVRRADAGDQKEIYYLIGETGELLEHSPYLEGFRAKGQEVLLLTDPIDEFVIAVADASTRARSSRRSTRASCPARRSTRRRRSVPAAARPAEGRSWRRGQGRAAVEPAEGERGLPGGRRGGDGPAHGAADRADGPRRRGAAVDSASWS